MHFSVCLGCRQKVETNNGVLKLSFSFVYGLGERCSVRLPAGPVLMSLRPGSVILNSLPPCPEKEMSLQVTEPVRYQSKMPNTTEASSGIHEKWGYRKAEEKSQEQKPVGLSNGFDVFECPPPKTENEVWRF